MRLQQHINETNKGSRGKRIGDTDALKILESKCSKSWGYFLENGKSLLRGMSFKGHFYHIDPKSSKRVSQNTENYYTLIIDNSSKWRKYPKRSESLILSNNRMKAGGYGDLYRVFPYDGSNFGICPQDDIWDSFGKTLPPHYGLGRLVYELTDMIDIFNLDRPETIQDLSNTLDEVGDNLESIDWTGINDGGWYNRDDITSQEEDLKYNDLKVIWLSARPKSFQKWIFDMIDPNKNGFRQTTDIKKTIVGGNNEVWTDGKAVLVSADTARSMWNDK